MRPLHPRPVARRRVVATVLLAALGLAAPVAAQTGAPADTVRTDTLSAPAPLVPEPEPARRHPAVSPLLPATHWAVAAVERAEALGLVHGWVPAQRGAPRLMVGEALRQAAENAAAGGDPRVAAMAEGWRARFAEEFRVGPDTAVARWLGGSALAGFEDWTGRLAPAVGSFGRRRDPVALPDRGEPFGRLSAAAGVGGFLAALAEPAYDGDALSLDRWEVAAGWRALTLSVGEMPVSYGVGRSGGVVLTDAVLPRVELRTERPVRLPGFLRHLGPVSAHAAVSRFDEERHPGEPYFFAMRAAVQPHPRFTVGVNRAAVFGGDSIATPVTLERLAKMFLGMLSREFENQVVSVDGRFRVPSESVLPLTLYLEWGAEDASGAWWNVPGIVGGAFVPALPGLPQVGIGAEYTSFSPACCLNPPWYFHGAFPGGWALDDRPLGHPLGGEGHELTAYAVADLLDARLRLEGRAFARRRGEEGLATTQRAGNLFSPTRTGSSRGGTLSAAWRLVPRAELRALWYRDAGDGWTEQRFSADLSLLF